MFLLARFRVKCMKLSKSVPSWRPMDNALQPRLNPGYIPNTPNHPSYFVFSIFDSRMNRLATSGRSCIGCKIRYQQTNIRFVKWLVYMRYLLIRSLIINQCDEKNTQIWTFFQLMNHKFLLVRKIDFRTVFV